jgi:hypothetical protein
MTQLGVMKIYWRGLFALSVVATFVSPFVCVAKGQEFLLKITVIDPGATADLQTRITPLKPFEYSQTHNDTKITLKGELSTEQRGSYHLRLTIAEWKDEKTNSTENYEVDLKPEKPETRGFISSFVFQRVILLANVSGR